VDIDIRLELHLSFPPFERLLAPTAAVVAVDSSLGRGQDGQIELLPRQELCLLRVLVLLPA
jgi:hypothetical protein